MYRSCKHIFFCILLVFIFGLFYLKFPFFFVKVSALTSFPLLNFVLVNSIVARFIFKLYVECKLLSYL